MKLELKHLAPYLPYGLKLEHKENDSAEVKMALINLTDRFYSMPAAILTNFKPILRPLSDLKQIEDVLFTEFGGGFKTKGHFEQHFMNNIKYSAIDSLGYSTVMFLIERHFDVFGLIPQGLAIDINTLKK